MLTLVGGVVGLVILGRLELLTILGSASPYSGKRWSTGRIPTQVERWADLSEPFSIKVGESRRATGEIFVDLINMSQRGKVNKADICTSVPNFHSNCRLTARI